MKRDRGRLLITGSAVVIALVILLFPPWNARAIRTTTRYAAVQGVAPETLVDTITWRLRAFPLVAPPRAPLTASEMRSLAGRAQAGDTAARRRLIAPTEAFEKKVGAPEILRAAGELWRDSVLAAAGVPSVSSYEVTFVLDDAGIALRLAVLAFVAIAFDWRRRGFRSSQPRRGEGHFSRRRPS